MSDRSRKSEKMKKVPCSFKLPSWLLEWMREQPRSQAVLIEQALRKQYGLTPPNVTGRG